MSDKYLIVNSGSASKKYSVYDKMADENSFQDLLPDTFLSFSFGVVVSQDIHSLYYAPIIISDKYRCRLY